MMACKEWNDTWVARLYDELDADETRRVDEHLADCAECQATMDDLAGASQLLRDSAPPLPVAPRLVVLQPRKYQQPAWAFVAGLATAAVLVIAALGIGRGLQPGTELPDASTASHNPEATAGDGATQAEFAALKARLNDLERAVEDNRQHVDVEMARWARRVEVERAGDVDFLLNEISAVERRTGQYLNNDREHILQAMLASKNPGLRQH